MEALRDAIHEVIDRNCMEDPTTNKVFGKSAHCSDFECNCGVILWLYWNHGRFEKSKRCNGFTNAVYLSLYKCGIYSSAPTSSFFYILAVRSYFVF